METTSGVFEKVNQAGVVAVLTIDREADAAPLARALLRGGVSVMELTLRTSAAMGALRRIVTEVPEMTAGIGTILRAGQAREAASAGAAFGVSPGLNPDVVLAAADAGLPFAPGIATPSEVERALDLGCRVLKFFPAEPLGGIAYLKAVAAPYAHLGLRYLPLGGIHAGNMRSYLEQSFVGAIGGSWIAESSLIREQSWDAIAGRAREAMDLVAQARGEKTG
ncbi:MAG TPA: bifunctional 4-hydroxy-2-oxoglutarate aldolase/2-dehydro-3-deoxy-phosphogluconate aldolase [Verrucomicrobiales bacterium]|nr:bifunctional 4-hydroxy-2-oxoglutarate aldolase/2-dehydro-3-deoxy-phosphogluconate aldolase [Verrucomicrobiales bacterium]